MSCTARACVTCVVSRIKIDRHLLAAQALIEDVPIVTNNAAFAGFGVKVVL